MSDIEFRAPSAETEKHFKQWKMRALAAVIAIT
jgi:hypothetical protein